MKLTEDELARPLTAEEEAGIRDRMDVWSDYGPDPTITIERLLATLDALRASPVADTAGIDAAWREAEAALPEGWRLASCRGPKGDYYAVAEPPLEPPEAPWFQIRTDGPTPAAALLALAAALRTPKPEGEPE